MSIDSKIVDLSLTNVTTAQLVPITGIGFEPKVIMFVGGMNANMVSGTGNVRNGLAYGFWSPTNQCSICCLTERLAGGGGIVSSKSRYDTTKAYHNLLGNGGSFARDLIFHVEAVNADGFDLRIDQGTLDSTMVTHVVAICLGGTDISAEVVQWTMPTSTGLFDISSLTFQPQALLHFYLGNATLNTTNNNALFGVGMSSELGIQIAHAFYDKNGAPAVNFRQQKTNASILLLDAAGAIQTEATFNSMGLTGFEFDFITAPAAAYPVITLALGSPTRQWMADYLDRPEDLIAATPTSQPIPTNGLAPKIFFLTSYAYTPSASALSSAGHYFGAYCDDNVGAFPLTSPFVQRTGQGQSLVAINGSPGQAVVATVPLDNRIIGEIITGSPIGSIRNAALYNGTCDDSDWQMQWGTSEDNLDFPTKFMYLYIGEFPTDIYIESLISTEVVMEVLTVGDQDEEEEPPPTPGVPVSPVCTIEDVCQAIAAGEFDSYIAPDGLVYPLGTIPQRRWVMTMEGTGIPPIEYVTQRGPFQHGETPLSFFLRPRIVQLLIRQQYLSRLGYYDGRYCLVDAVRPNRGNPFLPSALTLNGGRLRPGQLRKVLPDGTVYDLDVLIEQGPKFEPRRTDVWDEFAFNEVLRFIAFNPIFYNPTEEFVHCGLAEVAPDAQLRFPATFPIIFQILEGLGENSCTNIAYLGNWPDYPTIVIGGPAIRPTIRNLTTGESLELNYTIPTGSVVTFDLSYGAKTVTLDDGTNLIGFLTPESDLGTFHLEPGDNAIIMEADGVSFTSYIEVRWHRRYIGY